MPEISDQPGPSAQIPDSTPPPRSNGELWMETGVVLALGVLPDLFYAISVLVWPELSLPRPFAYDSLSLIVRASAVSVPVLYLIWRSGENWSAFGLERPSLLWDSVIGVMIWVMDYLVCFRLWGGVSSFLPSTDALNVDPGGLFSKPRHAGDYILLFISSCTNGFAEELVMRGYLIPRFERLLGSTWAGLFLSALLFASYHIYQGMGAALDILVMGLFYGGLFCLLRRVWPLAIAHALVSFVIGVAHGR